MIVKKAEILVFMQKASSLAPEDDALLDLVHPLAESAIASYLQQDLGYKQHVEYLPCGPVTRERNYPLDQTLWRNGSISFPSLREGTDMLQLKHLPVWTVGLEVREDLVAYAGQATGAFPTSSILVRGTDYFLDIDDPTDAPTSSPSSMGISRAGILRRIGAWPVTPRSIKVTYYGGLDTEHMANDAFGGALKLAALQTIVACYHMARSQAKSSGKGPYQSENIGKYSYSLGSMVADGMSITVPPSARELMQPFRNYGRLFA